MFGEWQVEEDVCLLCKRKEIVQPVNMSDS